MYFRAIIKDQQLMKDFLNTILTLSKLTKECVMVISTNSLNFIINEDTTSMSPMIWTEFKSNIYFDSYNMKGVDDINYKNILILINPSNFARALYVLKNSVNYCKLKLTNDQFPCITIDIELSASNLTETRHITHDLPVNLIPINDWFLYNIPIIQKSNIILILPKIRFIRNLIDKIKNLSPIITLYGTNEGELNIVAETESATICSRYRNLEVKLTNRDDIDNGNDNNDNNEYYESSCSIDCKKLAMFLSSLQTTNIELNCGIVRERLVQIDIEIGLGLLMHCIIPAVCD